MSFNRIVSFQSVDLHVLWADQRKLAKAEARQLIIEIKELNSLSEQGVFNFTAEIVSGYIERFDVLLRSPLDDKYRNNCSIVYNQLSLLLNTLLPDYYLRNNEEMMDGLHLNESTRHELMLRTDEGISVY